MPVFFDAYVSIRDFMELGGPVLNVIAVTILIMWVLIIERIVYFRTEHKRRFFEVLEAWEARPERKSWRARRIREAMISNLLVDANESIPMIKTLVALCPLLGLMGTVTGMIQVFDVMATAGSGNPRSMAAGVSQALVTTVAGMVGALSGVFAGTLLARKADREIGRLDESLTID